LKETRSRGGFELSARVTSANEKMKMASPAREKSDFMVTDNTEWNRTRQFDYGSGGVAASRQSAANFRREFK
jgi:hypothetical protein